MHIDIKTLLFVIGITHIIQLLVLSYQYLINKHYRGMGWWLMWSTAEAIGFAFMILREFASNKIITIIIHNFMFIFGVICLYIGIMRFFEKKENRWLIVIVYGTFALIFLYFMLMHDHIKIRGIVIGLTLTVVAFMSAHALLFYRPMSVSVSANFAAASFIAHGCFFAFRSALLLKNDVNASPLVATPLNVATYMDAMVCGILWTFALIVMINQRLIAEMKEAKEEMELVFNTSPDAAVISRARDGLILYANEGFYSLSGFAPDEVIGRSSLDVNIWPRPEDRQEMVGALMRQGSIENFEVRFKRKDGSLVEGLVSANTIHLQGVPHIISVTRDITSRKLWEEMLLNSEQKLKAVVHGSPIPQFVIDREHKIVFWNKALEELTGIQASEAIGTSRHFSAFHDADRPSMADLLVEGNIEGLAGLYQGEISKSKLVPGAYEATAYFSAMGEKGKWLYLTAVSIQDVNGQVIGALETLEDITERKRLEEQLHTLSLTDELTGLYNRRGFLSFAEQQLKVARRMEKSMILFFADLDNLKRINDTLGHQEGDNALLEVAYILGKVFRESDVIGRVGGDEFAILAMDTKEEAGGSLIGRLHDALAASNWSTGKFQLSLSIGTAHFHPDRPSSLDDLMIQADTAMYEGKRKKNNGGLLDH